MYSAIELMICCAARELEEETGYRAGKLEPLCSFYTSPGFMTEILHAFVATDLKRTRQQLDPTERIIVEEVAVSDALDMCLDGRIGLRRHVDFVDTHLAQGHRVLRESQRQECQQTDDRGPHWLQYRTFFPDLPRRAPAKINE